MYQNHQGRTTTNFINPITKAVAPHRISFSFTMKSLSPLGEVIRLPEPIDTSNRFFKGQQRAYNDVIELIKSKTDNNGTISPEFHKLKQEIKYRRDNA